MTGSGVGCWRASCPWAQTDVYVWVPGPADWLLHLVNPRVEALRATRTLCRDTLSAGPATMLISHAFFQLYSFSICNTYLKAKTQQNMAHVNIFYIMWRSFYYYKLLFKLFLFVAIRGTSRSILQIFHVNCYISNFANTLDVHDNAIWCS